MPHRAVTPSIGRSVIASMTFCLVASAWLEACDPLPDHQRYRPEVAGRLVDASGKPLGFATLIVAGHVPPLNDFKLGCAASPDTARTDSNGVFSFPARSRLTFRPLVPGVSLYAWELCTPGPGGAPIPVYTGTDNSLGAAPRLEWLNCVEAGARDRARPIHCESSGRLHG
jgi:hypothetical protein